LRRLAVLIAAFLALPALALASHQEPRKELNAADQRKAASVVLKRADFASGWRKLPASPDTGEHLDCPGYQPNESDLVLTGHAEGDFERSGGVPGVFSFSDIYKTKAHARASWTRGVKPALAACFARMMAKTIAADGPRVTVASSGRIAFPKLAPLTDAFRAVLRVSVTENGKTTTTPVVMNIVALQNGRGQAGLMTIGVGTGIPPVELRAFAKLLAQRLAAAKL
jgi:hypothetical protein